MLNHYFKYNTLSMVMRRCSEGSESGAGFRVFFRYLFNLLYDQDGCEMVLDYDSDNRSVYSMPARVKYTLWMDFCVSNGLDSERGLFLDSLMSKVVTKSVRWNYRNRIEELNDSADWAEDKLEATSRLFTGYDPFLWSRRRRYSDRGVLLQACYGFSFLDFGLEYTITYDGPFSRITKAQLEAVLDMIGSDPYHLIESWDEFSSPKQDGAFRIYWERIKQDSASRIYWERIKSRHGYSDDDEEKMIQYRRKFFHLRDLLLYGASRDTLGFGFVCGNKKNYAYALEIQEDYFVVRTLKRLNSRDLEQRYRRGGASARNLKRLEV